MKNDDIKKLMTINRGALAPLAVFQVDSNTIIGVYQGKISEFDILIKYRQKLKNGKWSRVRTPKHIHWAVDILMKVSANKTVASNFLRFLITQWEETKPIESDSERKRLLDINNLLHTHASEIEDFKTLTKHGEFNIEFLILLAKLLMLQEKTNNPKAYLFGRLLHRLIAEDNLYAIISAASFGGTGKKRG